ncbi:heme/hemin ABC transporter substrate-binding protein [Deinococcus cellulosilyticus]|uniref:Hemin ABC transporter substrate-binding protein n=1 Tax=Deinococcus cellulosilyticus (strain DSM 18568 / NBRC 106333 / KACC 11606 / 5516J-15) TaxID=1223518 RepID=A0A511N0I5_DEIC1|nr:ABC transporter substrate-binding protein [Deinococcus cellulosilyticus]GEM46385.1 hemin ABC transporter substrate-binding protein [Deinococcus cellulosilyticus NBRC 106333 = KACC 11606]
MNVFQRTLIPASLMLLSLSLAAPVTGVDGVTVNVQNPKRVVALNGSTLEIIFKLGKGKTVVGKDITGTFPENSIPSVGHWAQIPVEGVIGLKPDLVIGTADNFAMPSNTTLVKQLRNAGVPVLVLPSSETGGLDSLKTRIHMVAQAYGVTQSEKAVMNTITSQMSSISASLPKKKPKVLFLYAHGPDSGVIYGSGTGSEALIQLAGGVNVATFEGGSKPLTSEALVAMAPEAIIMLNRGLEAVGGVEGALKMPGVALTPAGKNRHIYAVDDSIRWIGPRLPEFALKLARQWRKDFR